MQMNWCRSTKSVYYSRLYSNWSRLSGCDTWTMQRHRPEYHENRSIYHNLRMPRWRRVDVSHFFAPLIDGYVVVMKELVSIISHESVAHRPLVPVIGWLMEDIGRLMEGSPSILGSDVVVCQECGSVLNTRTGGLVSCSEMRVRIRTELEYFKSLVERICCKPQNWYNFQLRKHVRIG